MTPRDRSRLEDMLDNARIAISALEGLDEQQAREVVPLYVALHAIQIVGEAASKLSPEVTTSMPAVPWRQIVDARNLIVHSYHRVRSEIVVEIVRLHLPPLIEEIEAVLLRNPE